MTDPFQEIEPSKEDQLLVSLYENAGRTVDDLPYTVAFEDLFAKYDKEHPGSTMQVVFRRLLNLRKAGRLPRLGISGATTVPITQHEAKDLADLVVSHAGTLGRRDQLVYTTDFESLAKEFNKLRGTTPLDHHSVWRLVARIAK